MNKVNLRANYDIAIIGGGLHACSIAAETASRGLSCLVVQAKDLAAGSSGGPESIISAEPQRLERLNLLDINLALQDLKSLQKAAPGLVKLRSVKLLDEPSIRPSTWVKAGVSIYRKLLERKIPNSGVLTAKKTGNHHTFPEFQVNRNRLIFSYARYAHSCSADILNYCFIKECQRNGKSWHLKLGDSNNPSLQVNTNCKILINCSGWQVDQLLSSLIHSSSRCRSTYLHSARLLIRRPKNFEGICALQRADKTLTYALPLDENVVAIEPLLATDNTNASKEYALLNFLKDWSEHFEALKQEDILQQTWTKQAVPMDYVDNKPSQYSQSLLDLNNPGKAAVLLNVFGLCPSKHRKLAEQALDILQPFTGKSKNTFYSSFPLPGAELIADTELQYLINKYPNTDSDLLHRLISNYGKNAFIILDSLAKTKTHCFGANLFTPEVDYLLENEWVQYPEDILWRRTNLGIYFSPQEIADLQSYINNKKPKSNQPLAEATY